jgi:hypothetical protein
MMRLGYSALFVWGIAYALSFKGVSAANANIVIGNCNNIVTLNFGDRQTVLSAIKQEYPSANLEDIDIIVEIAGCHTQMIDPKDQAQLLIFALNEMILIKEKRFLPAIDSYIANPTDGNYAQMVAISRKAIRKIDSAMDTLLSYEASVVTAATHLTSRLSSDEERLAETQAQLQSQLQDRLQLQLDGPLRGAKAIPPRDVTQAVMVRYRNQYAVILEEIKITLQQMIGQLKKVQAS